MQTRRHSLICGFAVGFLLVGASIAAAAWGRFLVTTTVPIPLPNIDPNGNVDPSMTNDTDFAKIFFDQRRQKAVAVGYGYTNNLTSPSTKVAFGNNPEINTICAIAIQSFVTGTANVHWSLYKVDADATPGIDDDLQAYAVVVCTASVVPGP